MEMSTEKRAEEVEGIGRVSSRATDRSIVDGESLFSCRMR